MAAKSSLGVVAKAEEMMRGNDAWHVLRTFEESRMFSGRSTAILHDIGDYKYLSKVVLHNPNLHPHTDLSKEQYMKKEEQTTSNHFHEKLLKLTDLMKTKAGNTGADKRHKFMAEYWEQFHDEWSVER